MSFSELRPSYIDFIEFISSGYNAEYVNIYLGFVVILFTVYFIFKSTENIHVKLITLYFSLSFFTNFAYQIYSVRIFDFIGILISMAVILILLKKKLKISYSEKLLFILAAILLVHLLILYAIGVFDKYGAPEKVFFQRVVMVQRLVVLLFVILYFSNYIRTDEQIDFIVSTFKYAGIATLFIMVIQEVLFFGYGKSTVGLNWASGFVPIPRFASVAVEGGHFGRLIPTFIIYYMTQKGRRIEIGWLFYFLIAIVLTNISLSLYGYLIFIAFSGIITHLFIFKIRGIKYFLILSGIGIFVVYFWFNQYTFLLCEKAMGLLIGTNNIYTDISVRRANFLATSLSQFPLGIGFGISNRFLPDGSFTDNGIYALISQLSLLSFFVIFIYLSYTFFLLKAFIKNKKELLSKRYAPHSLVMLLAIPFIFFFDIVWLYPGYILPFLVLKTHISNLRMSS